MEHKVILQITVLLLVDFLKSFPGFFLHEKWQFCFQNKRNNFFLWPQI